MSEALDIIRDIHKDVGHSDTIYALELQVGLALTTAYAMAEMTVDRHESEKGPAQ